MSLKKIALLFLLVSCAHKSPHSEGEDSPAFSKGEVILSTILLINIHDGLMPASTCVADRAEAELFLRVIRPRMDEVDLYLTKELDSPVGRKKLFSECLDNCTCGYLNNMLKDNKTPLGVEEKKEWRKTIKEFKTHRESLCLGYIQQSFCQSALMNDLENEKEDFMVPE